MKQLELFNLSSCSPSQKEKELPSKGANLEEITILKNPLMTNEQQPVEAKNERIPRVFSKVMINITEDSDSLSYEYFHAYLPHIFKQKGEIIRIYNARSGRQLCDIDFNGEIHTLGIDEVTVIDEDKN